MGEGTMDRAREPSSNTVLGHLLSGHLHSWRMTPRDQQDKKTRCRGDCDPAKVVLLHRKVGNRTKVSQDVCRKWLRQGTLSKESWNNYKQ